MSDARARPIPMSAWEVRALLDRGKTQARRVFTVPTPDGRRAAITSPLERVELWDDGAHYFSTAAMSGPYPCPFGRPGDLLFVREAAWICPPRWTDTPANPMGPERREVAYKADDLRGGTAEAAADYKLKLTPSIHMPRWASRLTLELTDVRAQRVQEISEEDAEAEGIEWRGCAGLHGWRSYQDPIPGCAERNFSDPRDSYRTLWDSLNAKKGDGWDANPFVWCLSFSVIHKNVDEVIRGRAN